MAVSASPTLSAQSPRRRGDGGLPNGLCDTHKPPEREEQELEDGEDEEGEGEDVGDDSDETGNNASGHNSSGGGGSNRAGRVRLSMLTRFFLLCGHLVSLFISFNVLRVRPPPSSASAFSGDPSAGWNQTTCSSYSSLANRTCAAAASVPDGEGSGATSLPAGFHSLPPFILARWPPLIAAVAVFLFAFLLLRTITWLARRVAVLEQQLRAAEEAMEQTEDVAREGVGVEGETEKIRGRGGQSSREKVQGGASQEPAAAAAGSRQVDSAEGAQSLQGEFSDATLDVESAAAAAAGESVAAQSLSSLAALVADAGCNEAVHKDLTLVVGQSSVPSFLEHEIRGPLRGAMGVLQLLMGSSTAASPLDPMQQDFVHTVQACVRGVAHNVSNFRDRLLVAEAEATAAAAAATAGVAGQNGSGRGLGIKLEDAVFELRSVVDEVLAMYGGEGCEKGLEMASLVMDSVPSAVVGDPLRLRQVLMNLFTVAVRLTEAGHVFLCVRLAPDDTELTQLMKQINLLGQPARTAGGGALHRTSSSSSSSQRQGTGSAGHSRQSSTDEIEAAGSRGSSGAIGGDDDEFEDAGEDYGGDHSETSSSSGQGAGSGRGGGSGGRGRHDRPARQRTAEDAHAERAARGTASLAKGECLTLSGRPAADSSNSWTSICGMMREQEERFRRLMKNEETAAQQGRPDGAGTVRLVFSLEDTGAGIPDRVYECMQTPLAPLPEGLQQRFTGVPVLLSVAQKLVEAMGGQLLVFSRPGVGTTMTFDITLTQASKLPGGGAAPARVMHLGTGPIGDEHHPELASQRAKLRGLRCLVVDGKPVRQQVTATYMARLGLRVDLSDSVPAAALALRHSRKIPGTGAVNKKCRWDIVVVDHDSDGPGSGIELGRMLQQLKDLQEAWEPAIVLPKLVLVAQSTNEEMEADAGKHGFSCIMLKPLRATTMATALMQALGMNPGETTTMAVRRRQILLRLCLKSKKVMVVDHLFVSRKAAAVGMSRFADVCLAVESGREALSRLELPHDFHLILVNMQLADMPGPEFIDAVRAMELQENNAELRRRGAAARRVRTPILGLVTGSARRDSIARWRSLDIDGLLTSPLDEVQLMTIITRLFKEADSSS